MLLVPWFGPDLHVCILSSAQSIYLVWDQRHFTLFLNLKWKQRSFTLQFNQILNRRYFTLQLNHKPYMESEILQITFKLYIELEILYITFKSWMWSWGLHVLNKPYVIILHMSAKWRKPISDVCGLTCYDQCDETDDKIEENGEECEPHVAGRLGLEGGG